MDGEINKELFNGKEGPDLSQDFCFKNMYILLLKIRNLFLARIGCVEDNIST